MNDRKKRKTLRLSVGNSIGDQEYYAELSLPAKDYEVRDAMEKIRASDRDELDLICTWGCEDIPDGMNICMDDASFDELNYLAKRLAALNEKERIVYHAVLKKLREEGKRFVHVKELINSTYGLGSIPVVIGMKDLEELGEFAVENDMIAGLANIPQEAIPYLDLCRIGGIQKENDGGVFTDSCYVAAGHYQRPEIYDGKTLPQEEEPPDAYIFSLRLSQSEKDIPQEEHNWVDLPMSAEQIRDFEQAHGGKKMPDFYCHAFLSCIPQLNGNLNIDMREFYSLNQLAEKIASFSAAEQIKWKAVLSAEKPATLHEVWDTALHLGEYEFSYYPGTIEQFFKDYLRHNLDEDMDSEWLDMVEVNPNGQLLMERLDATLTDYGVISARGCSLYAPVPCKEAEAVEKGQQMAGPQL